MTTLVPVAVSPLRQRLIDEMDIRRFGRETQRNYIRDVDRFATFLGRSPDTATAEDVRRLVTQPSIPVGSPDDARRRALPRTSPDPRRAATASSGTTVAIASIVSTGVRGR